MSIRVNLPDGSVANFPDGMDPQAVQAEIERYMAQSQQMSQAQQQPAQRRVMTPGQNIARDVGRLRDTIGRGDGEFQENFDYQQGQTAPQAARERPAGDTRQRRQGRPAVAEPQPEPQGYRQPTMAASEINNPAMRSAVQNQDSVAEDSYTDRGPSQRPSKGQEAPENRQMPMNAMEQQAQQEAQRRGPDRRNADVQIRDTNRETLIQRALRDARTTSAAIVGGMSEEPNPDRQFFQSGGLAGDIGEVARRTPAIIGGVARSAADLANTVVNPYVKYATGYEFPTSESRRENAEAPPPAAEQASAQNATPPEAQNAAAAAGQPAGELPSVQNPNAGQRTDVSMPRGLSIQDAREQGRGENAMTFNMADGTSQTVPVGKPGKASPQALKNGTKTGMDYILEQGEQYVLQRLKRGDIAGAMEFRNFMRNEQNQRGLENYNRAVVSTTLRDTESFAKSTAGMVRYLDPDGDWEVETKGTQLLFSDDGQVTGAEVALKNKRTGETLVNEYQGMKEVLDGLGDFASPTAGIERQRQRVEQAQAQKIENANSFSTAYDEAVKMMFPDGFVDGRSMQPFTPEQRQQADTAVREYIASSRPDLPQPPPRQAPVAPPPAAASGVGSSIRSFFGGTGGDKPIPTMAGM
ncbi:hypothetical protein [Yoonia sp.]|uniref:hypothetical protein n=1 Tax=Yoonia sp. TaxID=2212373 RepID=UPI002E02FD5A|nr:hypothetical protein [Yoonia sp.]